MKRDNKNAFDHGGKRAGAGRKATTRPRSCRVVFRLTYEELASLRVVMRVAGDKTEHATARGIVLARLAEHRF